MTKGFFTTCDISESHSVCFWLFLPFALLTLLVDSL